MPSPSLQKIEAHRATIGAGMPIRRALPQPQRRMIGAWCFLDHAGPVRGEQNLRVGPHPHVGLQTFTWMLDGELLHRDSLGYEQRIRPGQVNLMTAGRGIAHSEESVPGNQGLHMAQLWIALPESHRHGEPAFHHYPALPQLDMAGFRITVLAGDCEGERAPTAVHTPLLGLDLTCTADAAARLELNPDHEHGVLVLDGALEIEGEPLEPGTLAYLPPGRSHLPLRSAAPVRALLLGGAPFPEKILQWWNFVARTQAEVEQATRDWNAGQHFGEVRGFDGPRLKPPDLAGLHLRT